MISTLNIFEICAMDHPASFKQILLPIFQAFPLNDDFSLLKNINKILLLYIIYYL